MVARPSFSLKAWVTCSVTESKTAPFKHPWACYLNVYQFLIIDAVLWFMLLPNSFLMEASSKFLSVCDAIYVNEVMLGIWLGFANL